MDSLFQIGDRVRTQSGTMEGTIVASYEFYHALRYVVAFDNGTEGVFFAQELMTTGMEPLDME